MAGIEGARVSDDRIIFPEGTKQGGVKIYCKTCPLDVTCHGFDSKGFAEVDRPRNVGQGQVFIDYIKVKASCLNQK